MRSVIVAVIFLGGCTQDNQALMVLGQEDMAGTTCGDRVKSGDETDIDCGGSCAPCTAGKGCLHAADCLTRQCDNNVCAATDLHMPVSDAATLPDAMAVVDAATVPDSAATRDLSQLPDLGMPDLASAPCSSNQQCMGLSHAAGQCTPTMTCAIAFCDLNWADCDKDVADGCESDSLNDAANCNFCGVSCLDVVNGTGACQTGACVIGACQPGYANCDGQFATGCPTAITSDPSNCGGCGKVCAIPNAQVSCANSVCSLVACVMGFADCDGDPTNGCETVLSGDAMNCGACGAACPMNAPACENGACVVEDFPPVYLLYILESP